MSHGYYRTDSPRTLAPFASRTAVPRPTPTPRPRFDAGTIAAVLLAVRSSREGHVAYAILKLTAQRGEATRRSIFDMLRDELGDWVYDRYVSRGIADGIENGTVYRTSRGCYELGLKLSEIGGNW